MSGLMAVTLPRRGSSGVKARWWRVAGVLVGELCGGSNRRSEAQAAVGSLSAEDKLRVQVVSAHF